MLNRVVLVGRLTKDPELRKTPSGASVVNFTIAVNRMVKRDQNGGSDADFVPCVAWNRTAELMTQYTRKGALIGVDGRLQTRNYDGQDGKKVFVTEVVADSVQFLEPKSANDNRVSVPSYENGYYGNQPSYQGTGYGNSTYGNGAPAYGNQNQGFGNNPYGNQGYNNQPNYQQGGYSSNQYSGYGKQNEEIDNDFDTSSTLDISSDDLPF